MPSGSTKLLTVTFAVNLCDSTLAIIDRLEREHPETYQAGFEFFASVYPAVKDVRQRVYLQNRISERQSDAIRNWHAGVLKWDPIARANAKPVVVVDLTDGDEDDDEDRRSQRMNFDRMYPKVQPRRKPYI